MCVVGVCVCVCAIKLLLHTACFIQNILFCKIFLSPVCRLILNLFSTYALQQLLYYSFLKYSTLFSYDFLGFVSNCSPGTYSALTGQSSIATCSPCPRSYYCPNYGTVTGFICPANSYCPQGTITYTAYLCPAGTFNLLPGLYSATQCNSCPIGNYCVSPSVHVVHLFF